MLPLALFEDTVDDMERRFPHEDVVVDEVVGEDPDGAGGVGSGTSLRIMTQSIVRVVL